MRLSSDKPLVSVVILCHNQEDIIGRAIKSVVDQTYTNIQLVIVDDCSKDSSRVVIESWKNKFPDKIKYFIQPQNVRHPRNMNMGYKLCDGELVTFCDGDDWYFPEKVEREVEFLKAHPDVDVVHSNFDFFSIDGKFTKHWATNEKQIPQGDIYLSLFSLHYPYCVHLRFELTSKKILEEAGYYDERIPIWVDWDLRLRLASKYKYGYCHYVGSVYAENPEGITKVNKQETILKYLEFIIDKNKVHLSTYSPRQIKKAMKAINRHAKGLKLAINFRKQQPSFGKTLKYLVEYPQTIKDWRFLVSSMFGSRVLQSLSGLKRKLYGKKTT